MPQWDTVSANEPKLTGDDASIGQDGYAWARWASWLVTLVKHSLSSHTPRYRKYGYEDENPLIRFSILNTFKSLSKDPE